MKTLGILGGVGPQTTSKTYLSIIKSVRESGSEKYPPIVIYNLPFPFIIENEAVIQGVNSEKMIPYLADGAKILEKSGADFGILPCNTLHKFIDEIRNASGIPFLSILEETISALKGAGAKNVGILATETTIRSGIYENALKPEWINITHPSRTEQSAINNIIVELLNGKEKAVHKEILETICGSLCKQGADIILMACTDLQLAASAMKTSVAIVDTTDVLIKASVREMINP